MFAPGRTLRQTDSPFCTALILISFLLSLGPLRPWKAGDSSWLAHHSCCGRARPHMTARQRQGIVTKRLECVIKGLYHRRETESRATRDGPLVTSLQGSRHGVAVGLGPVSSPGGGKAHRHFSNFPLGMCQHSRLSSNLQTQVIFGTLRECGIHLLYTIDNTNQLNLLTIHD